MMTRTRYDVTQARFGAIVIGALVTLLLQLAFTLLASGIGLSAIPLEAGQTGGSGLTAGAIIYGVLTLIVSFFIGAMVAARIAGHQTRFSAATHGLGLFSLVSLSMLFFATSQISSAVGGLVSKVGMGAGAAGAAAGFDQVLKQIEKVRIVTDMSVVKGKAITQIQIPGSQGASPVAGAAQSAQKEISQAAKSPQVKEAAGEVRQTAAKASFGGLAILIIGSLSSVLGGIAGRREYPEFDTEPELRHGHRAA